MSSDQPEVEYLQYEDSLGVQHVEVITNEEADPRRTMSRHSDPGSGSPNIVNINTKLNQLSEENIRLRTILQDVRHVNKRWQKYNEDLQLYVRRLLATMEQMKKQMSVRGGDSGQELQESGDADVTRRFSDDEHFQELLVQHEKLKEENDLLRVQLKTFSDDWSAEQREKTAAISELKEMKSRCKKAEEEVKLLKKKVTQLSDRRSQKPRCIPHLHHQCCCPHPTCDICGHHIQRIYRHCRQGVGLPHGVCVDSDLETDTSRTVATTSVDPSGETSRTRAPISVGFDGGLASVTSFEIPVTSSSSRSLDGGVFVSSAGLQMKEPPPRRHSLDAPVVSTSQQQRPVDMNQYSEEGIQTITYQEIRCPSCTKVFQPGNQLQFIDHFEQCQRDVT